MSAVITLGTPAQAEKLLTLCAAFHAEEEIASTEESRTAALMPLLEGNPYGAVYLIGPPRAPIGYIAVCFTWSLEHGGLDALIDELYVRPGVRGRGIASEVLSALPKALGQHGLRSIHLEVAHQNTNAQRLYRRAGFVPKDDYMLMMRTL
ncbi:MAG: N-acetyltransferase [Pseudomonadota bacterium]